MRESEGRKGVFTLYNIGGDLPMNDTVILLHSRFN